MLKKYLPHTSFIGFLILAFLVRVYLFSRGKTDPTALDIYNIIQIGIAFVLGLVVVIRRDFIQVVKLLVRSPLSWLITIYLFGILSGLWSAIPLFSTYFAIEGLIFIIAFAMILYQQKDNESMERIAIYSSYTFILLMLGSYIKTSGFSLNLADWHTNNYSAIAAMLFGYCFGEYSNQYREKTHPERKLLRRGIWFSLILVIIGTSSASNIALVTSIVVVTLISGKRSFKILSILLFVSVLLLSQLYGDLVFKILFPGKTEASVEMLSGRTHIWEYYLNLIEQKPIAGWGFAVIARISKIYTTHTHNSLIEIVGGLGIIGLGLYTLYLILMLVKMLKHIRKPYTVGILGALTAGFINGNAISFIGSAAGAIFFAFIIWNVLGLYAMIGLNNIYSSENEDNLVDS